MWLQSLIFASVVAGAPACESWQADIADIDSTRYAGKLNAAIEKVEQLKARCPARSADEDIQLHLLLAKIHDRIGLHNNTRPVARALAEIEMAQDLRADGNARSAASIELAYAKYYYRAEMSDRLFEKAEAHARRAITGFEAISDRRGLADAVHALGLIHFQRGELDDAKLRFVESLRLENRDPEPRAEMLADYNRHMAFVLARENRREEALPLFRKSFEQRRDGGLRDASIFAAISYGNILVELGRAAEASELLAYALKHANSIESSEGIARTMGAIAKMHESLGDPEKANATEDTFTNPILRGGYPDPSICRVGEDFYIVNSSFEYFPGLPLHHSNDLVNWELVGYGLHREEQVTGAVNLVDVQSNGGIHAPTLRCRDGMFYIITTNVYLGPEEDATTEFVNFVITAENIEGPWSEPHVIEGAPGIDPDLFFDDDGRVWYVGTHTPDEPNFPGEGEIWLHEIDPDTWKLIGERYFLWRGACGGVWAEGPHIYKRDGRYYLLVAEGGTSFNHAVTVAISDDITGPYHANPRNPILTSRHLGYDNWVNSTGHADIVELADGRWYMVALGIRGDEERSSNMGRETHLIPMTWQREPFEWKETKYLWPVAAPLSGRVERNTPLPFEQKVQVRRSEFVDDFESDSLKLDWNFRRVPMPDTYSLTARNGFLRLNASPGVIKERGRASLLGIRQTESDFEYRAKMQFSPAQNDAEAGIALFQKDNKYLSFTVWRQGNREVLRLVLAEPDRDPRVLQQLEIDGYDGDIVFQVVSGNSQYAFAYSLDHGENYTSFATTSANHILAHGSYTGAYLGLYSTSNGSTSAEYADFDWIRYTGNER